MPRRKNTSFLRVEHRPEWRVLRTGDEEEIVLRIKYGEKHSGLKISSRANQVHVGYWWEYFGGSSLVISSTIGILAKGEEWPEQAIRKEQK
jgi:hypothetical protein